MKQTPKFSVLISIYEEEKPQYLIQCLNSLLQQTLSSNEWVIVEDGALTEELYKVLDKYEKQYPDLIKRVKLHCHMGLGAALSEGIRHCSYELIARMDADDVACKERFERQIDYFINDPKLDICGSWIEEFEGDIENVVSKREVPVKEKDIRKYQKRRDAFNHMTVMYKKQAVLNAGNYKSIPLMEDTVLWVQMLRNNVHCTNIPEYLVKVRVGNDYYERRGGWRYFKLYRNGRKEVLKTGFINRWDYFFTVFAQFFVALTPIVVRGIVFKYFLHKKSFIAGIHVKKDEKFES